MNSSCIKVFPSDEFVRKSQIKAGQKFSSKMHLGQRKADLLDSKVFVRNGYSSTRPTMKLYWLMLLRESMAFQSCSPHKRTVQWSHSVFTSRVNNLTKIEAIVGWVSMLCSESSEKCSEVQILHWDRTKQDYETLNSFMKWALSSQSYYWIIYVRECLSMDSASGLYILEVELYLGNT